MDLGLERAGMTCKWQVEIDPFCNQVLAKHWPNIERFEDVRTVGAHNLAPVDLICGGPPCQPYSVAGKRRGAADDRNLWPEFLRVVGELKPHWVLFENVPGIKSIGVPVRLPHVVSRTIARLEDGDEYLALLTQQERMYLDIICENLEAIGYEVVPLIVPAAAFSAPHLRYRVFVIAHSSSGHLWDESGRRGRTHGQSTTEFGNDGAEGPLAHAQGQREAAAEQPGQLRSTEQGSEAMANPNSPRTSQPQGCERQERRRTIYGGEDVPDPNGKGLQGGGFSRPIGDGREDVENSQRDGSGAEIVSRQVGGENSSRPAGGTSGSGRRPVERRVRRMVNGLSQGLDGLDGSVWDAEWPGVPRVITGQADRIPRLKSLGNAVLPQEVEWIGRQIMATVISAPSTR